MPILTPKQKIKKTMIRISLDESLLKDIEAYTTWAGFSRLDEFFEQAAEYVLAKDKDWKKKTLEVAETVEE